MTSFSSRAVRLPQPRPSPQPRAEPREVVPFTAASRCRSHRKPPQVAGSLPSRGSPPPPQVAASPAAGAAPAAVHRLRSHSLAAATLPPPCRHSAGVASKLLLLNSSTLRPSKPIS
ncbi:hypothetical protein VPH35_065973 [Triticum aestivum]